MGRCDDWLLSTAEERRLIRLLRQLNEHDRLMMIRLIEAMFRIQD